MWSVRNFINHQFIFYYIFPCPCFVFFIIRNLNTVVNLENSFILHAIAIGEFFLKYLELIKAQLLFISQILFQISVLRTEQVLIQVNKQSIVAQFTIFFYILIHSIHLLHHYISIFILGLPFDYKYLTLKLFNNRINLSLNLLIRIRHYLFIIKSLSVLFLRCAVLPNRSRIIVNIKLINANVRMIGNELSQKRNIFAHNTHAMDCYRIFILLFIIFQYSLNLLFYSLICICICICNFIFILGTLICVISRGFLALDQLTN